jgi:pilus assembly protein Flp/PilA
VVRSSLIGFGKSTRLSMSKVVLRFVNNQEGATAIEYALIAAGISIVIVAAVNSIGTSLNSTFSSISSQLK